MPRISRLRGLAFLTLSLAIPALLSTNLSAFSQTGSNFQEVPNDPGIAMALYPIKTDARGKQFVVTKLGIPLPLPGDGLNPGTSVLPVYRDQKGNYWFVDKHNKTIKVTEHQIMYKLQAEVNDHPELRNNIAAAQGMIPAGTVGTTGTQGTSTAAQPPVVINNNQSVPVPTSSGGSNAAVTGLAAAGGAMAGAAIGDAMYGGNNSYYGAPYYHPITRDARADRYYYNRDDGQRAEWNDAARANNVTNQWKQQHPYQDSAAANNLRNDRLGRRGGFRHR